MKKTILLGLGLILLFLSDGVWAAETPKLNYRLKWLKNISVIGDLYADKKGYFAKAGLNVTVKSGGPERDAIRELELGLADFGVASADQVIRALSKGAKVVVLAQFFQTNPLQWIYRDTLPELKTANDLKGLTLGITYGGNDETIMRTLLAQGNIAEKDVDFFSVRYDFTPFYQRKADLWPVYKNAQGPILIAKLAQSGEGLRFFNPAQWGVKFVANSLITSQKNIEENPDVVKRFTQALLEGWRDAFLPENREEALNIVAQHDRDTSQELLKKQYSITETLVWPDKKVPLGKIDMAAWEQTEEMMHSQNLITKPVDVTAILKTGLMDELTF